MDFVLVCVYSRKWNYRQVSNIRRILVGNVIVDHSDVVGASPVGAAPTTSSFFDLTPGLKGLGKDNCKTRRETFNFGDLVHLILQILRYASLLQLSFSDDGSKVLTVSGDKTAKIWDVGTAAVVT